MSGPQMTQKEEAQALQDHMAHMAQYELEALRDHARLTIELYDKTLLRRNRCLSKWEQRLYDGAKKALGE